MKVNKGIMAGGLACRRGGALGVVVVALVVIGAVVAGGWAVVSARGSDKSQSASKSLFRAAESSFLITTTSNGSLAARNQTEIRSEVEGQTSVTEVVPEGSLVKEGDILIKLSTDQIDDRLREAEDRLRTSENQVNVARSALQIQRSDNDSALRQAEVKLELARLELQKWTDGDLVQKRNDLKTALERAEREEERLRVKLERSEKLFERGFYSQDELEQDRIQYLDAQATLFKSRLAQETFEEYEYVKEKTRLESDVREAEAELERVKTRNESQLSTKQSELDYAELNLRERQLELKEVQEQLDAATIEAPTDGLVVYSSSLERNRWNDDGPFQVGSQVYENQSLIVLPDTREMMAVVKVHESLVSQVKKGQKSVVTIDAAGGKTLNGTVDSVSVLAQSDNWRDPDRREYEVKIALDLGGLQARDLDLKPGMRCEAQIQMDRVEGAIAVPLAALFIDDGVNFVYTPEGGKFRRAPVRVGRRSETEAEILAGLNTGTMVLLREPTPGEVIPGEFGDTALASIGMSPDQRRGMGRRGGGTPELDSAVDGEGAAGEGASSASDEVSAEVEAVEAEVEQAAGQ